jgi:methyl coenzyme M reductase gamma subunit
MKTLIAAAIVATLSTPALANKEPVGECLTQEDLALQMTIYHLDQVAMVLEQMREDILLQYPKDVDQEK